MIADDSMSDDVFEMDEAGGNSYSGKGLNVLANTTHRTPSPTGYKDYQPPKELFETKTHTEEIAHKTILLGDSGVGKTSLLVQFDTGKFKGGNFAATVGIGFMV
ncbi:hypothetical protein Phum_PHUM001800 [Pediculus humanus corporis]|uniref:Ras-related protein Rab-26 n=1 Tax=Pediculus humanus subsp. corporis TaxID=121224 RepID=E0V8Y1_PEDHC|nr:uncharacterized protein Phum_PHUM001800 [Pediculus humanus corporis]EEB09837.1 hypothetical protein Phum_PHUM001800 [Pediculus humanus corporis]